MSSSRAAFSRRAILLGAAGATGLALAACAPTPGAPGTGQTPGRTPVPTGPAPVPVVSITAPSGLATLRPEDPIEVEVTDGKLAEVTATAADGTVLAGEVTGSQWKPERNFLVRTDYTLEVVVTDNNGEPHTHYAQATTVNPELVVEVDLRFAGQVVGNGLPVWVRFDMPVNDDQRAAIEQTASITTNPPQEGSWGWFDQTTLWWRPRDYWQPNSTAHVEVKAAGLPAGDTWVLADVSGDYQFGDLRVLQTNIDTHTTTCLRNGEVVQILPVSMGKPGWETMTGTKLIMEKNETVIMDSESFGVPHDDPDGYRIVANKAQRITWSGEYYHAAPWADYAHGNSNVSHGCTGLSDANAAWLFDFTMIGDPAEFTGSTFPVQPHQTWGAWVYSWDDWQQLSALT
ncbi:MAG: Ig-like domain-containing protein [Brooklawnia sp.]|jgi:lipoprotein-anchoring transpeptidase ErfK/SrfK